MSAIRSSRFSILHPGKLAARTLCGCIEVRFKPYISKMSGPQLTLLNYRKPLGRKLRFQLSNGNEVLYTIAPLLKTALSGASLYNSSGIDMFRSGQINIPNLIYERRLSAQNLR